MNSPIFLNSLRYTPSRLKMMAVSAPPSSEDIASHCEGLPSVQYPSDHIYLCCDASLNLAGTGGSSGGMSLSSMALRHQMGGIHSTRSPSPGSHVPGGSKGNALGGRMAPQPAGRR